MKNPNTDELRENPAMAKLELLVRGVRVEKDLKLNPQEANEKYFYDSAKRGEGALPSEIILPGRIVSNLFVSEESPYSIWNRTLFLGRERIEKIFDIKFTPEARFSRELLSDGMHASRIAAMYGLDVFALFLNRRCYYSRIKKGCEFCSSEYTSRNKGRSNCLNPKLSQVIETLSKALEMDRPLFNNVLVSSGAYADPDRGIIEQMRYIRAMKKIDDGTIKYHLVTIPPRSDELLHMLADELESISFDLEVFDPQLFRKYCPGKDSQIAYDDWLRILEKSSSYFKKGSVKIGFVGGLEPLGSLVKGMEFVGKLGLAPAINIFHPDEGTHLADSPRPSTEYIICMSREQARIYKEYELVPVFPEHGRRSSLDTEVYKGFFDGIHD
jgi:hypothetical protein